MSTFWNDYWNRDEILVDADMQSHVQRTVNHQPVSCEVWEKTLNFIWKKMEIGSTSDVLELCCGNGMLTIPLAQKVRTLSAIDFSTPLIEVLTNQLKHRRINNVTTTIGDITNMSFTENNYSHVLIYFALQHFSERDAIILFQKVYQTLKNGGKFYIGDIPDREKLWDFACNEKYVSMYFESIKKNTPAIGTWFLQNDMLKMSKWAGFKSAEIIIQPEYQINSRYRFDLLLQK
jgi:ubiquinone/menaquinone biosynthesis C-methylase UbiE